MYSGQIIMSGQTGYSPWFERQANGIKVQVEYLNGSGTDSDSINLTVSMETKNEEEIGDGAAITNATTTVGATGFGTITIAPTEGTNGMKQLVRFKMVGAAAAADQLNWVYFRILAPTWYDNT